MSRLPVRRGKEIKDIQKGESDKRIEQLSAECQRVQADMCQHLQERHTSFLEMNKDYSEMQSSFDERIQELYLSIEASVGKLDGILKSRRETKEELEKSIKIKHCEITGLTHEVEQVLQEQLSKLRVLRTAVSSIGETRCSELDDISSRSA